MKKNLSALLIICSVFGFSQKFTISAGASFPFVAAKQKMDGSGTDEAKPGFNIGASTAFVMNDANELELGAYYQHNKLTSLPPPGLPASSAERNLNLVFIPVNYKYNFGNQFFIKGGPIVTIDTYEKDGYFDNYSGLGFGISAGKDFGDEGFKFRVAPFANAHTLWSFNDNNYFINDLGIQLGLVF